MFRPSRVVLPLVVLALALAPSSALALRAPSPRALSGYGSQVREITLYRIAPLVVTGANSGDSNFIVHLVSRGFGGDEDFVFNEIGPWHGQALLSDAKKGRYRVSIQAAGTWTLRGSGSRVIPIQARSGFQALVSATHRGDANFIVHMTGYGWTTGEEFLFNEIGNYSGQTLVDVPRGPFLVDVQADGPWTIRFSR